MQGNGPANEAPSPDHYCNDGRRSRRLTKQGATFGLFHDALQKIGRFQILVMLARQPVAAQSLLGMGLKSHNETLVP